MEVLKKDQRNKSSSPQVHDSNVTIRLSSVGSNRSFQHPAIFIMSILIGNTRIWFPHRRTYSSKTSEGSTLASKYCDKGLEESDSMHVARQDLLFNIPGPEKHIWTVLEVPPQDDPDIMQMASWKRPLARLVGFTGIVPTLLILWNAITQSLCLIEMGADHATPTWRLVVACYSAPTLPLALVKLKIFQGKFRPRLRLVGADVPFVDVIIPCCNEPLDVLQDTILAAIALDYPEDRFRVIVTDDGGSVQLRAWVSEQGQHNLCYTARIQNSSSGFKACNLNHAIQFIEKYLAREPAEFIASLDGDMIPEKKWAKWLRGVIPHLVLNPKIEVVCPTQGWKTAYVAESLQYGLMPESYLGHIKQFTRGNLGGIQMATHFRFCLFQSYTGSLTVWQRLLGLSYGIMVLIQPIFMAIDTIATPIYLVMGVHGVLLQPSRPPLPTSNSLCHDNHEMGT
ncbi:uncharacterized protein PAC_15821 [Phialocephala subalpina]|uniref:Glycosyltransferase 2-like domain-containing protein n=1 Tax=Phialocephala subalpina TaxID=576137 RepID=A0A1L7XLI7_9HELO|nr:uncharacterized protein PAC_15821 [Phialocephala subalpina]